MSYDFTLYKNRTKLIAGQAKYADGTVVPISSPKDLVFRIENLYDSSKYLEKSISGNPLDFLRVDNGTDGEYLLLIRPGDTEDLPSGDYRWELTYIDDPNDPNEVYTVNPTSSESGLVELKDNLIEVGVGA